MPLWLGQWSTHYGVIKMTQHATRNKQQVTSGFEMCFGLSTLGAGAKTSLEARCYNKED